MGGCDGQVPHGFYRAQRGDRCAYHMGIAGAFKHLVCECADPFDPSPWGQCSACFKPIPTMMGAGRLTLAEWLAQR